jgi:NAD(P)-dependent dehydrogenase (short-subunit alcohol dehydrogenase family)
LKQIFELKDRHMLVTGATSGIGRHVAQTLAEAGATVTVAGRRQEELQRTVSKIETAGGRAQGVTLDVKDPAQIDRALADAERFSGPLHGLINNAGILGVQAALAATESDWDDQMETNLKGAWLVQQRVAQGMVQNGIKGSIVNISSIAGSRVMAWAAVYSATKAGLEQLTRVTALEWAQHGIRVNAIAPGFIRTEANAEFIQTEAGQAIASRIPLGRIGDPSDLDGAILLLASDAGRFITGSILVADGGHMVTAL